MPRAARSRGRGLRRARKVLLVAAGALAAAALAFWLTLPSVAPLRHGRPASTALMEARAAEARASHRPDRRRQQWVPLDHISPWLQQAVVNSEDARFYVHHGIDQVELDRALEKAMDEGRLGRGASTLTQQLAKNLWLGEERSLWRKAREYFLARRLESLGKDRILELYLNVVEWGTGIYGAEAASRTWFGKPARALSPEEASILAAMLPAPRHRNPRRPSRALRRRAHQIVDLFGMYRELDAPAISATHSRLDSLLGPE